MHIDGMNSTPPVSPQDGTPGRSTHRPAGPPEEGQAADQVELSFASAELDARVKAFSEKVLSSPEVRSELVDSIRERLKQGEFHRTEALQATARRMLEGFDPMRL